MKRTKKLVFHFAIFPVQDSYQTGDITSLTKESRPPDLYRGEDIAISITLQDAKEVPEVQIL